MRSTPLSSTRSPIAATEKLRNDYTRYLNTIYAFDAPALREEFARALREPDFLVKGPILEASAPFQTGRSIAGLVQDGVLCRGFDALCSTALPADRPLYLHQDRAVEKLARGGRNVVVATGTGSGKTEAFLIPILDHLLRQEAAGVLGPGVRALLLYPMNALANDQLRRLRALLGRYPAITFGRYTGETREKQREAEAQFREEFPEEPLIPNELLSREALRGTPPHLLITNYAMLEYLLLRPADSPFFDGPAARFWRFIVLDEAHVYDGAAGIEVAMLLRRLKDRVAASEPGRLQCVATSATLGQGRQDAPQVAEFARQLFGEPFAWEEDDPSQQDVVLGARQDLGALREPWGAGSAVLYNALVGCIGQEPSDARALAEEARAHGVPEREVAEALARAERAPHDERAHVFLYALLEGDARLHALREALGQPQELTRLAEDGTVGLAEPQAIVDLVRLAAAARARDEDLPLLPARYHVFARALEGAFICLNEDHPAHREEGKPRLFLHRHRECPHCGAPSFEVASCVRCGATYIIGSRVPSTEGLVGIVLSHPQMGDEAALSGVACYLLDREAPPADEDEAASFGEEIDDPTVGLKAWTVCLRCGAIAPREEPRLCGCPPGTAHATLHEVEEAPNERRRRQRCVCCGARNPNGTVFRMLTGRDAPVSVLATSLYQTLPPAPDAEEGTSGQGRKLLSFADSRQDAAFFAPYLEHTYGRILERRMLMGALDADGNARSGCLRLDDLAPRLLSRAEEAGLFGPRASYDERHRTVRTWLMRELVSTAYRIGPEGLGLLHFRPVRPPRYAPPAVLLEPPWNLSPEEAWTVLQVLLDTLRRQGAVTFPEGVEPRDDAFKPRNVAVYVGEVANPNERVLGWMPKRGSNGRLSYLVRLLVAAGLAEPAARDEAERALQALWPYLVAPRSPWRAYVEPANLRRAGTCYRLRHELWEWVPVETTGLPVYRCDGCGNVIYSSLRGICPTYNCRGTLRLLGDAEAEWRDNHYRHLYRALAPVGLAAEEHTAQWRPDKAGKVQDRFVRGEVNVLSCSTTFELGVDVGTLQAVLMRNVPPSAANYVQRAGRAGRRTDSVALVLTFAQRRSHDLSHYRDPSRLVGGRVPPPRVHLENERIVRRHAHSVLLAAFFRWALEAHGRRLGTVGAFFERPEGQPSGTDLLREYAAGRPAEVLAAMRRIVPEALQGPLEMATWGWLRRPPEAEDKGLLDHADLVEAEVQDDLAFYAEQKAQEFARNHFSLAEYYHKVAATIRGRDLLGFLASRNVLPKYGFPTDVVALRTDHVNQSGALDLDLQRDLRMAVAEYAPGSSVVAAKHVWQSRGLHVLPGKSWQSVSFAVCPDCQRFHRWTAEEIRFCQACGASLRGGRGPKRRGTFLKPEFGFVAGRDVQPTGEERPERLYASQVYFAEYAEGPASDAYDRVEPLSRDGREVRYHYSRYGRLIVVNTGRGNGFRVCTRCGWAEPAGWAPSRRNDSHEHPRTGRPCGGRIEPYHLGHDFLTDVLELRFSAPLGVPAGAEDLWESVLAALLEGASWALDIPRDDLGGTLYPYWREAPPGLVLYDNVPGGAGYVRHVADHLETVVRAAHRVAADCTCGEETSCYECLRSYYNQRVHDRLQRSLATKLLGLFLTDEHGSEGPASGE